MDTSGSFCDCDMGGLDNVKCHCGEEFEANDWSWEEMPHNPHIRLSCSQREVLFNPVYSVGTAAVRGTKPFIQGWQYLWEIKMLSSIHGTDVVVGVGTAQVDLTAHSDKFIALVGHDSESWGFSYQGDIIHGGNRTTYGPQFRKGSIVGVLLNMWTGTLEFYLNRQCLGVAFRVPKNRPLFPMVCSTMGNSSIRLVSTMSWPVTLELSCLQSISSLPQLSEIPGLRAIWGKLFRWRQAIEVKRKSEEQLSPDTVEYELEIISSDEEEQERISVRSRRVLRRQQKKT
ncbi:hypothetical protein ONE63_005850 [Megalurothrips usitatus]|uniref:B30.2/SPRY domain-containing protein n=1 Tax=Megalurothrips usitatus TaxID=439358 RepID=A0AAV7XXI2_9NEOP|nr:hypothetical protein ONE63_005850 [Megalurothrips usitatus]